MVDNGVPIEDEVWLQQTSLFRFPVEGFDRPRRSTKTSGRLHQEVVMQVACREYQRYQNGDAGVPGDRMCDDSHAGPYCQQCIDGHIEEAGADQ